MGSKLFFWFRVLKGLAGVAAPGPVLEACAGALSSEGSCENPVLDSLPEFMDFRNYVGLDHFSGIESLDLFFGHSASELLKRKTLIFSAVGFKGSRFHYWTLSLNKIESLVSNSNPNSGSKLNNWVRQVGCHFGTFFDPPPYVFLFFPPASLNVNPSLLDL